MLLENFFSVFKAIGCIYDGVFYDGVYYDSVFYDGVFWDTSYRLDPRFVLFSGYKFWFICCERNRRKKTCLWFRVPSFVKVARKSLKNNILY